MFALLALAGDLGCAGGPTLAGLVSDACGGALRAGILAAIIFPLLKSVTFTVIVIDVMWIWNDFLLPLLMVNSSNETKTLVLSAYTFVGQFNTQWHYAMAAMVLAVLPSIIIFIFLQKYIVEGVVAGAVKG